MNFMKGDGKIQCVDFIIESVKLSIYHKQIVIIFTKKCQNIK